MGCKRQAGALGPFGAHLLGALGALGPIWGGASGRPKADIMEAEGRLNGGLGAEPPGKKTIFFLRAVAHPGKLAVVVDPCLNGLVLVYSHRNKVLAVISWLC